MAELDFLKDVRSFYSSVPKQIRDTFGPRNVFDSAEFRFSLKDNGKLIAFIEAKLISNKTKLYYNIGFKEPKYCNPDIFNTLFENIESNQYIMQELCSTYGTDFGLQELLKSNGFVQIADRTIILKNQLINDASHIHFIRG